MHVHVYACVHAFVFIFEYEFIAETRFCKEGFVRTSEWKIRAAVARQRMCVRVRPAAMCALRPERTFATIPIALLIRPCPIKASACNSHLACEEETTRP